MSTSDWSAPSDRAYLLPTDELLVKDTTSGTAKNITAPHAFGAADATGIAALSGTATAAGWGISARHNNNGLGAAILGRIDYLSAGIALWLYGATTVGSITTNGTSTSYNTTSDYRLKDDLQPMADVAARFAALAAGLYNFRWKVNGARADGWMAHEFGAVIPEGVHGEKDAMQDIGIAVPPAEEADKEDAALAPMMDVPVTLCPKGWAWTKTGTRIAPQGIDQGKAMPLVVAQLALAVETLGEAVATIATLNARITALEAPAG